MVGGLDDERVELEQAQRVDHRRVRVGADGNPQPAADAATSGSFSASFDLAASRATASAERLPAEPPLTKPHPRTPEARRVGEQTQHLVLGADRAGRLEPRDALDRGARDEHVEQQRAFVGADGMNPRKRGLSAEITAGAIAEA